MKSAIFTATCDVLWQMATEPRDVSKEIFFIFLEILSERLEGKVRQDIIKDLEKIKQTPDKKNLTAVALNLISLSCISNADSCFRSFCSLIDDFFAGSNVHERATLEVDFMRQLHGKLFRALRSAIIAKRGIDERLRDLELQTKDLSDGMNGVQDVVNTHDLQKQKSKHIWSSERNRLMITNDLMHLIGFLNREAARRAPPSQSNA